MLFLGLMILAACTSNHAELVDEMTCDPTADGEWNTQCDMLDTEAIFAADDNQTARFQRAVEVLPGLRLPSLGDCPDDPPLTRMVSHLLNSFFHGCVPVLRYDRFLESSCGVQRMLAGGLDMALTHGRLSGTSSSGAGQSPVPRDGPCATPVFLLQHVEDARSISRSGTSHAGATLLITASPLWRVEEFLLGWEQRPMKLVIVASAHRTRPVASTLHLEPWFPNRIAVAIRHEPPFTIHRPLETESEWTGIEPTLLKILSQKLNFTFSMRLVPESEGAEMIRKTVAEVGGADMGIGGLYLVDDTDQIAASMPLLQDCAVFMTRASTALPRHRAILGPFQLAVWLTLTASYMLLTMASAAGPHNKEKADSPQSRLDSFWLVFGTFTNAFIIRDRVWSQRASVRLLLTFYWIFTVIITAAYTSSIIAFVTLPIFPATIDTAEEIISTPGFRWGTLGNSGWDKILRDSDDPVSRHVQAGFEWLPNVEDGIRNVSLSPRYAFLGSRERLQYESSDDLSGVLSGKKALHLASQCFLPLLPVFVSSPALIPAVDSTLLTLIQSGVVLKASRDVAWQEQRRRLRNSVSGVMRNEFTRMMPHERKLGLEDVIGTFLLLGAGMILGSTSFGIENFMRWFRLNDVMGRMTSAMAHVRRRVSQRSRSGSNSATSSKQSLRLRSGRLWSRTSRGSRLGSTLDIVPERGDAVSSSSTTASIVNSKTSSPLYNGSCKWAASAPNLEQLLEDDLNIVEVEAANATDVAKRPKSSK